MTVYAYRCKECGAPRDSLSRDDVRPCFCGGLSRRDYSSIQIGASPFRPHFNFTTGTYVNNRRQFEDHLNRRSDNNSEQTGMDHRYVPLEPGEVKSLEPKTDTAIIEAQTKALNDRAV